jgi:MFS family permease
MADASESVTASIKRYNLFLLLVAGLGGLLYGIDVGIIAGALPYMEATSGLNAGQLSFIVAAVLLGSVISTLFAGMLSDFFGRKPMMILSGVLFVLSIPMIAWAEGFGPLVMGRLLQGISAGFIGVVIPLYLAECLGASSRGKGTGIFQWLLTLGIVVAAGIGYYFSIRVEEIEKLKDADQLFAFKDTAWRSIFWMSLPPGLLFVIGSFIVAESPRWLFRGGKTAAAKTALLRSRTPEQADVELKEMAEIIAEEQSKKSSTGEQIRESLFQRRYVIPFVLACIILACNQATGINSIIGYNATILIQAGLSDKAAHLGYVILTLVNFLMTIGAVILVDMKGRKFLLSLGSAGIIVSLICVGMTFQKTEKMRVDCADSVQKMVSTVERVQLSLKESLVKETASTGAKKDKKFTLTLKEGALQPKDVVSVDKAQTLTFGKDVLETKTITDQVVTVKFDQAMADKLLAEKGEAGKAISGKPTTMIVIYSYGDFRAATKVIRSTDTDPKLEIDRGSCVPSSAVEAFFKNPFADLKGAQTAPLKIENALITPIPSVSNGWLTAFFIYCFCAFFAVGPGVCVWLALSELMPTRIRSNGMSVALLINQAVSTVIAAVFLPTVGKFGYGTMFFAFAGFTVIYFVTAFFFLPETKGKTLEEIEEHFEGKHK